MFTTNINPAEPNDDNLKGFLLRSFSRYKTPEESSLLEMGVGLAGLVVCLVITS